MKCSRIRNVITTTFCWEKSRTSRYEGYTSEFPSVKMGSVGDFCRLCARSSETVIHVFSEEGLAKGIAEKIQTHLPIVMTPEDCLPTLVCSNCLDALEVCHSLFQVCLDADVQLRKMLNLPDDPDHIRAMMLLRESLGTNYVISSAFEGESIVRDKSSFENEGEEIHDEQMKGEEVGDGIQCVSPLNPISILKEPEQKNYYNQSKNSYAEKSLEKNILHTKHCANMDGDPGKPNQCDDSHVCCEGNVEQPSDAGLCFSSSISTSNKHPSSEGQDVICHFCGAMFKHQQNLKVHMKKHQKKISRTDSSKRGKRQVECRVCGEQFESFWYMVRHRSDTHSKEEVADALRQQGLDRENFECNVCGKLLSCQTTLKQHMQRHSKIRNFHCEECGHGFAYKAQLKAHLLNHTGGPHSCPECPKHFRNAFALRVHVRTHTGEKPFPCEHCSKAFHSRANYEQHLQVHSNVRKFKCTFCPYRARRPDALRLHIRVHTNERPYMCKFCGRAFKQKSDCKKHENLHERKPGSVIKARRVKEVELLPGAQTTNEESLQSPSPQLAYVGQNEETNIAVSNVISVLTDQETAETTTASAMITTLSTESAPKIYEYQDGGVREIVISGISFEDSPGQGSSYWNSS